MFDQLILALLIFLSILRWIVIFDAILSWSVLFWVQIRIPFVRSVLDPMYLWIRRTFPTSFSGLDFAPILLLLGTYVLESVIISLNPAITARF